MGQYYGYFVNVSKTWLVIKEGLDDKARSAFGDTNVQITSEGRPYLGSALESPHFVNQFVSEKVQHWSTELKQLSSIAISQPHAAFAAYISSKWSYVSRTIPNIGYHLQKLEDIVRCELIPNLTGRPPPNDSEGLLMALPARLGGLGITNPSLHSDRVQRFP